MKKILVAENIILDKELFDSFYSDAKRKGVLVISNKKGRAEMSTGIFILNGIPDMSKDDYYIKKTLFGLTRKYGCFHFTPKRFQEKMYCMNMRLKVRLGVVIISPNENIKSF